jgi:hypothetical protein
VGRKYSGAHAERALCCRLQNFKFNTKYAKICDTDNVSNFCNGDINFKHSNDIRSISIFNGIDSNGNDDKHDTNYDCNKKNYKFNRYDIGDDPTTSCDIGDDPTTSCGKHKENHNINKDYNSKMKPTPLYIINHPSILCTSIKFDESAVTTELLQAKLLPLVYKIVDNNHKDDKEAIELQPTKSLLPTSDDSHNDDSTVTIGVSPTTSILPSAIHNSYNDKDMTTLTGAQFTEKRCYCWWRDVALTNRKNDYDTVQLDDQTNGYHNCADNDTVNTQNRLDDMKIAEAKINKRDNENHTSKLENSLIIDSQIGLMFTPPAIYLLLSDGNSTITSTRDNHNYSIHLDEIPPEELDTPDPCSFTEPYNGSKATNNRVSNSYNNTTSSTMTTMTKESPPSLTMMNIL